MQISQVAKFLDKTGLVRDGELSYEVKVIDVKIAYGVLRFKVIPLKGEGSKWVTYETLTFKEIKENAQQ